MLSDLGNSCDDDSAAGDRSELKALKILKLLEALLST